MILSIDTSSEVCSVAVHEKGILLYSSDIIVQKSAAELITVFINRVFEDLNITASQLDAIAVAKGPGSYTGLRIAVSTAKGLCLALNKPLISVNTLQAMAKGVSKGIMKYDALLCPMIDARRMEVYCAVYDADLIEILPTNALIVEPNSFDRFAGKPLVLFGSGSVKCKPLFIHDNISYLDYIYPSATNMGEIAFNKFKNNQFEDLAYFEPYYLKEFISTSKLT